MIYHVLGKTIAIETIQKTDSDLGVFFEFTGSNSLKEIGLNQKILV